MATQLTEFSAPSGQTVTAELTSPASDTVVQTASAVTEASNRKGVYTATFTNVAEGVYRLIATNSSGVLLARWWVDLTLTTATFQAYETPVSAITADIMAHTITKGSAGSVERAFWQASRAQASAVGEVSGTPTASAFDTDLTAVSGAFDHLLIVFTSGSLTGEARPIDTYSNTSGRITLQEALTAAPSAADEFLIVPNHVHKISDIQNGLATGTAVADVYDLSAWLLTASVGAISNAQSAAESFELILGGVTYTVTGSGMTETGNRGTTTLSKV